MDGRPRYCPACGTGLTTRPIEGRERAYCPTCAEPVYRNPKPCAGVLVVDDDELLLVKRTNPPGVGTWSVPAGFLEYDEPPVTGAVRELEEETGLRVAESELELFDTVFTTAGERTNVLVVVYRAKREATAGVPEAGSDAGAARFWDIEALAASEASIEPGYEDVFRAAVER